MPNVSIGATPRIEWLVIPSWPNYEVSSVGQIRRRSTKRPLKLRPHETNGHLYFLAARGRKCYAHRAVLEAFEGPCPPGQQGRHLDGVCTNNMLDNLKWGTPLENTEDKRRHGTIPRGESAGGAKLTEAQVLEIRRRHGTASLRSLAREFGVSHTAIRRAALGIKWAHLRTDNG